MLAPRIGLLVTDGVTLAEVTPMRERLAVLGVPVTILIPSGGALLPVSGRYFPAAGCGEHRALSDTTSDDLDVLLLPETVSGDILVRYPDVLQLVRGRKGGQVSCPVPVYRLQSFAVLLDSGRLQWSGRVTEGALTGSTRGR